MKDYIRCTRCIMDNVSDDTISFDKNGHCNYCTRALGQINTSLYFPNELGESKLKAILEEIKAAGKGKKYDCIMGISGGLDSSYLAYLGHKWGLRILAVHINDGFDTEISRKNISKLVSACNIDMLTVTPDPYQFNALTKAYMKAGVPNLAAPQDNVLFAFLYDIIRKNHISYFLSGENFALECILQRGNTHSAYDLKNMRSIHRRFGEAPIDKLKFISYYRKLFDSKILGLKTLRLLDLIDYNRSRAFRELYDFCGFEYYGRKHLENILTAFVQLYWMPKKFGVDKRSSHLSSMIVSGQMTREEALKELEEPLYDEKMMAEYIAVIKEKLSISDREFEEIMAAPCHQHEEYGVDHKALLIRAFLKHITNR